MKMKMHEARAHVRDRILAVIDALDDEEYIGQHLFDHTLTADDKWKLERALNDAKAKVYYALK
jgi:hypothetical protein